MESGLRRHPQRAHHGRDCDGARGVPDAARHGREHGEAQQEVKQSHITSSHCISNNKGEMEQSSRRLLIDFFFIPLLLFRCSAVKLRQEGPTFWRGSRYLQQSTISCM